MKTETGASVLMLFAATRVQHVGAEMRAVRSEERLEEPAARRSWATVLGQRAGDEAMEEPPQ